MKKLEKRGNYITCQKCNYKFKFKFLEQKNNWVKEKYECPSCKEKYCNKPKTERRLFVLQDEYFLSGRDSKKLESIIKILMDYTKSLILKMYPSFINSVYDLEYYTHNTVVLMINYYLERENFRVHSSFAGLIKDKIKQARFCKEEKDIPGETLDYILEDGNEVTHRDEAHSLIREFENKEDKLNLCIYLSKLIFNISTVCDPYEDYKRILAVRHYLVAGEKAADKLFQEEIENKKGNIAQYKTYGRKGKYKYMQTLDLMKQELENLNRGD